MADGVVRDLSFGELVSGDADKLAAQDNHTDDDSWSDGSSADSSSEESSRSESSWANTKDDTRQTIPRLSLLHRHRRAFPTFGVLSAVTAQNYSLDVPLPSKQSLTLPQRPVRSALTGHPNVYGLVDVKLSPSAAPAARKSWDPAVRVDEED